MTAEFPPIRACIFDVDGLLINSEDIYTEIYNHVLRSYNRPPLPWEIKALQQSRGTKGTKRLLEWANLTIPIEEWNAKTSSQHSKFKNCTPLPGILELLSTLSKRTTPRMKIALASSAGRTLFNVKTSHIPGVASAFPESCRVFGDDPDMGDARKKPMPDIFLLALERINALCEARGEENVKPEECLVFEDSIAGVEAGRRAGMRVVWVPHESLADVCRGREREVLEGRMGIEGTGLDLFMKVEEVGRTGDGQVRTEDGWAEMLRSLEVFPYDEYGICLVGEKE